MTLPGALSSQMLEEKFDAFRREVQSLGQAKVQALRELAGSLERTAPRCAPQIQAQRSRIEAAWGRLDRAIKARTQVSAPRPGQAQPRGRNIYAFCLSQGQADPPGGSLQVCVGVCMYVCVRARVCTEGGGCL